MFTAPAAFAGTVSPVQSTATPLGQSARLQVQAAGSDARAQAFYEDVLPLMLEAGTRQLGERRSISDLDAMRLDPTRMQAQAASDLRIYFIGEGAGHHNSLFSSLQGTDGTLSASELVFPDASSSQSYLHPPGSVANLSPSEPLLAGDFVDIGPIAAGETLVLDLISNGAFGGTDRFSTDPARNDDGLATHVVSMLLNARSAASYVLMGFEDLFGGGDQDYNDLIVAVDFGTANVDAFRANAAVTITPVPVPPSVALLGGAVAALLLVRPCQGGARRAAGRRSLRPPPGLLSGHERSLRHPAAV